MVDFTRDDFNVMTRDDIQTLFALPKTLPCKHSCHALCSAPGCKCPCHVPQSQKTRWMRENLPSFKSKIRVIA